MLLTRWKKKTGGHRHPCSRLQSASYHLVSSGLTVPSQQDVTEAISAPGACGGRLLGADWHTGEWAHKATKLIYSK